MFYLECKGQKQKLAKIAKCVTHNYDVVTRPKSSENEIGESMVELVDQWKR